MKNNIYLVYQEESKGYDTYDSMVVVAPDEETAKRIDPSTMWGTFMTEHRWNNNYGSWASSPDNVYVKYLGKADESQEVGLVLSSFNAG
jgi:hypothetical protein